MTKTISNRERLSPQPKISPDLISAQQQSDEVNQNTSKAVAQSTVQHPSGGLQIVHATNGRVRLRVTDSSLNSILDTIAEDLRSLDGVREVSVNQQTGSFVVNFAENKLSLPELLAFLPNLEIQKPQASPESASKTDFFAAWKSLSFWKEQGISLIPMMTGLAVTRGLAINGWISIPVYMMAADATRGVIGFIGSQLSTSEKSNNSHTSSDIKDDRTPEAELSKVEGNTIKQESSTNYVEQASEVTAPAKMAYRVVHAIPGRIRLHVPKIAEDRAYGRRLERLLKTDTQVTSVRVNFDAASIAIAYQSHEIPLSYWVSLIKLALEINPLTHQIITTDTQPLEEKVNQPAEPTEATTAKQTTLKVSQPTELINSETTSEQTTLELSTLWADLKPPAMSFSLGIMANLPLES